MYYFILLLYYEKIMCIFFDVSLWEWKDNSNA